MAYDKVPEGIVGTKVPKNTEPASGPTMKKFTKKHIAIVPIRNAKNP